MDRRSFLKRLGGAGLAVVAAPLFIPAERLAFGVPRGTPRSIVVPEPQAILLPDAPDWKMFGGEAEIDRFVIETYGADALEYKRPGMTLMEYALQYQEQGHESDLIRMFEEQSPLLSVLPMKRVGVMPGVVWREDT